MQKIDLNTFKLNSGESLGNGKYCCPECGLELESAGELGAPFKGVDFVGMKFLALQLETDEEHSLTFNVDFYKDAKSEEFDMSISFSILPKTLVTVPIDLNLLDSQKLFPPRTNGRLRMIVYGKPIRIEEISCIKLTTLKCHKEQIINIKDFYLTDILPDCSLEKKAKLDEIGQWIPKDWQGKLKNREECNAKLLALKEQAEQFNCEYENPDWDKFGGWKKKSFEKTGWFHTANDGKRWWLVDPDGNAFFSTGSDSVNPGADSCVGEMSELCAWIPEKDSEFAPAVKLDDNGKINLVNYGMTNLIAAFGETWWEDWAKIVKMYLYRWNVNTIANWSSIDFVRYAKMPYVLPLNAYSDCDFPTTEKAIFRDFPDVFAAEYEEKSEVFAKTLNKFKDDSYMIGYFMRNEPNWGFVYELNIAEEMLASPEKSASKLEFINRMKLRYENIKIFNTAWKLSLESFEDLLVPIEHACSLSEQSNLDLKEFSAEMVRKYVEIPAAHCKKVDPNHLNLGMRYAFITDPVMLSGHECFDVFSINSYQMNPYSQIDTLGTQLNMPIMIGEFHFGSLDKGLTSHGLRGVTNQSERGNAYRYYVEQGSISPYFLGGHYFMFNDQSAIGRFDGENYQIGLLDVCLQEYTDMTVKMAQCHRDIYEVCAGENKPFDTQAKEVPAVHC